MEMITPLLIRSDRIGEPPQEHYGENCHHKCPTGESNKEVCHLITFLFMLLCSIPGFAAQSTTVSTTYAYNAAFPALSGSWRAEFMVHDWSSTQTANSKIAESTGLTASFTANAAQMQVYNSQTTGGSTCTIDLTVFPSKAVYVRYQHVVADLTDTCEAWDATGTRRHVVSYTYTSESAGLAGMNVGGTFGEARSVAFFRIHSTTVALNSTMPVTADNVATTIHWKFEGDLTDASGNGYTASMSSGGATYITTPSGYRPVVARIKTSNATVYSDWVTLRAGQSNAMDGTASFSEADASSTVTCFWQVLSTTAASLPKFSSHSSCTPTLSGVTFGDYNFQLTVTDVTSATASTTLHIGAASYDSNGVIIQADANADTLFGPMIAFGKNPWGYADERAMAALGLQTTYYNNGAWPASQPWMTAGAGTVSYPYTGKGPGAGTACTTLAADVTLLATTVEVTDATCLSLSSLPTWIRVGNSAGAGQEIMRVCSTTATTGAATLTLCFDGRGVVGFPGQYAAISAWSSGTTVGEMRVQGTSTLFATDPNVAICPAGVPGPAGRVVYSTGTVTISSTTVTGSGTTWNGGNGVAVDQTIRVAATHSSGTPFVFWARITAVTDTTHLTIDRAPPLGTDAGSWTYKIVAPRYWSLGFVAPNGSTQRSTQQADGCESETAAFAVAMHDITGSTGVTMTGQEWSYIDGLGALSAFGSNFYGSGLAQRALYQRSGLAAAKSLADQMDNWWTVHPEICAGYCGGLPLGLGGGAIGAMINLVLNPDSGLSWDDVEGFVRRGDISAFGCNELDTRDSGYMAAWTTLGGLFAPAGSLRTFARTAMQGINTRDNTCKTQGATSLDAETNSWAHGFVFNSGASPALTLTNGSAVVTGTGLTSDLCHGIASVTLTATNGSSAVTGTGFINGSAIMLTGTKAGQSFSQPFDWSQSGGTVGVLGATWTGDSGTVTGVIVDTSYVTTIATSNNDITNLAKNWACTFDSSTQLTLDRPWDGATGSSYHIYTYVVAGYGQQPFMLGIKSTGMKWGSNLDDELTPNTNFGTNGTAASTWVKEYGYDPFTQGMTYGRVFGACEPLTDPPASPDFVYRNPNCNYGRTAIRGARALTAETSTALRGYYEANVGTPARDWGDTAYGSVWGYAPYTEAGYYSDSDYVRDENSNVSLASYKWPGFFFGMGMAHQWPAVRVGGVTPPDTKTFSLSFELATGADLRRLYITRPSGEAVTVDCAASPCNFTYRADQGSHVVYWEDRTTGGTVLARSEPMAVQ